MRKEADLVHKETGEYLELDIYLPSLNIAFEYQVYFLLLILVICFIYSFLLFVFTFLYLFVLFYLFFLTFFVLFIYLFLHRIYIIILLLIQHMKI